MNIDTTTSPGGAIQQRPPAPDQIDAQRKNKEKATDTPQADPGKKSVQGEELLSQIKAITEDGLYSIRFEQNENDDLIVKIFDQKTDKMVRQIPAEELLKLQTMLEDMRGNILNSQA